MVEEVLEWFNKDMIRLGNRNSLKLASSHIKTDANQLLLHLHCEHQRLTGYAVAEGSHNGWRRVDLASAFL